LMIASIFFIAFQSPGSDGGSGPRWNRGFVSRSRAKVQQGREKALDRVEIVRSATPIRAPKGALALKLGNMRIIAPSMPCDKRADFRSMRVAK
jgi:hypothetical protein